MRNASATTNNSTANETTRSTKLVIRRSPIAVALAGIFGGGVALAANTITPILSTTLVTPNNAGTATDITTSLIRNATGVNAFSKFVVDSGQLVNLHIPTGATQLLNLVNDKIIIDGTVNSLVSNKVGGKLIFASPNGMLVGAAGVLNVGSLVVRAPNQTSFDVAGNDLAGSGAMADLIAGNGTYARADAGLIQVNGKIFAPGGIILDAATVTVGAGGSLVASDSVALQQSVAAVNTGTLIATDLVSVNGVIEILGSNIAIGDSGRVVTPGVYDNGSIVNHGANVTLTAPSITLSGGSQILAQSKDGVLPHGTVTLLAQSEQVFDSYTAISHIKSEASANISIDGKIEAGKIDAQAKARAIYDWQEKLGPAEIAASTDVTSTVGDHLLKGALGTVATALTGANIGVAKVDGSANIKLGAHADLKADGVGAAGGVVIKAETSAELSLTKRAQAPVSLNPLFTLAFVYADNQAHSTVRIEDGAKIDSKGKIDILAQTNTLLNVSVTTISNESVAVLAGALTSADIEAKVEVQKGALISADETVTIKAANISRKLNTEALSMGIAASKTTAASLLGAAVAYTDLSTAATVNIGAQITSRNESVLVTAKNQIDKNVIKAKSQLAKELDVGSSVVLGLTNSSALVEDLGGKVFSGLVSKISLNLPGSSETKPSAAGALAYGENQHAATVQIADSAVGESGRSKIDAANAVYINATLIDAKPETSASAEVATMPGKTGTGVGIAAAVAINTYQHDAQAIVGKNAEISARAVDVRAKIDMINPNLAGFTDFFNDISDPKKAIPDAVSIATYPNGQTSSASKASANSSAVNGSVSWISFADNSNAKIDSGVQIHLKQGAPTTLVDIDENNVQHDMVLVNGVAVTSEIVAKQVFTSGLIPVLLGASSGEGNAKSLGGNVNYLAHSNHSSAIIADGVSINQALTEQDGSVTPPVAGKEVQVKSNNDVSLGVLTWASGSGGAFGANLMFAMTDLDESSHAIIDRSAHIVANKVGIDAKENLHDYTVAGTYSNAKETGVALSVAVNSVKTDTVAAVTTTASTNNQADYSAVQGLINASQVDVSARTDGEIWAGSLAVAVSANDKAPAWAPEKPATTPDTSALGKVKNKIAGIFTKAKPAAVPQSYKPDFGLSISGSSSANDVQMGTHAYLDGAHVVASDAATSKLNVQSVNAARIGAVSGGVSVTKTTNSGAEGSAAVAGAFAYNDIDNVTDASIHSANHQASDLSNIRSVLGNFNDIGVTALVGGEQFSVALGVGANASGGTGAGQQNSSGIAGSAAASTVKNAVSAVVSYATIESDFAAASDNNLHIRALDDILLGTGAGGLTGGSSKSVGGAFTYSAVSDTVTALLDHASVENYQGVAVNALTSSNIYSGALGAAWSKDNNAGSGVAASGSVVVNTIKNSVTADVKNSTINSSISAKPSNGTIAGTTKGVLDVSAGDTVDPGLKFSELIAAPASTSGIDYSGASSGIDGEDAAKPKVSDSIKGAGSSIVTVAGALSIATGSDASSAGGIVIAYNDIKNKFTATVLDSVVDEHTGSMQVNAASNAYILDVAAGLATTTGEGKFAAAGVIAVNEIANTIQASVSGSSPGKTKIDANLVQVSASDSSHIDTAIGALAVSTKSNAVGGAIAYAGISNTAEASISIAELGLQSSPAIDVSAENHSGIRTLTVAAGVGKGGAVGVVAATSDIHNTTSANLQDVTVQSEESTISVNAKDDSSIQTLALAVAGGGTASAVGAAIVTDLIGNSTHAAISGGDVNGGDILVSAKSNSDIQALAVGVGGSSQSMAVAGSVVTNEINNDSAAKIDGSGKISAKSKVRVSVEGADKIDLAAGYVAISGMASGVGASVLTNVIKNTNTAAITGTVVNGADVVVETVMATEINALSIGVGGTSNGLAFAGSVITNEINSDSVAKIDGGAKITASNNVLVNAEGDDRINLAAGGLAVSGAGTGIGASIVTNGITSSTTAAIEGVDTIVNASANGSGVGINSGKFSDVADINDTATISSYHDLNLKNKKTKTVVNGVAVNASATQYIESIAVNVAGGTDLAVAGNISINHINKGISGVAKGTRAYIDGATVNSGEMGDASRVGDIDVRAGNLSVTSGFSGALAAGVSGGGVGIGFDGELLQRETLAYIQGANISADNVLKVDANAVQAVSSLAVAGAAGSGVAVGLTGSLIQFDATTLAYVKNGSITAHKFDVDAATTSKAFSAAGAVALSGSVAGGAAVAVVTSDNDTKAFVEGSTNAKLAINVDDSVAIDANSATRINDYAVGVGIAGEGALVGSVIVNKLTNDTVAYVNNANVGSGVANAGELHVSAKDSNHIQAAAGALGVGLSVAGAGVAVVVNEIYNTVDSHLSDSAVHANGGVVIDAQSKNNLENYAIAGGGGLYAGIGAAVAITLIGDGVDADHKKETDAADKSVNSALLSGPAGSPSSAPLNSRTGSKTIATIGGGSTIDSGSLSVTGGDRTSVFNVAGGLGVSVGLGVGAAVSVVKNKATVEASLGSSTNSTIHGDIIVSASADDANDTSSVTDNHGIQSRAYAGAVALLGAVTSTVAYGDMNNVVVASLDGIATADGNIDVTATDKASVVSDAKGVAMATAAAGVTSSSATKNSHVSAMLAGGIQTANGSHLNVDAGSEGEVSATSLGGALSELLSLNGSVAIAKDSSNVAASTASSSRQIVNNGLLQLNASATPDVIAKAQGLTVAYKGAAIGISIATAEANQTVIAQLRSTRVNVKDVAVRAELLQQDGSVSVKSLAESATGGLVAGQGAQSDATLCGSVSATSAVTELNAVNDLTLTAKSDLSANSQTNGLMIGAVAAGATIAHTKNTVATSASLSGVNTAGGVAQVTAQSDSELSSTARSGSGGVLASFSGAVAGTESNTVTKVDIGGTLKANSVQVLASKEATFNSTVDSINAGLVGGSGATAGNTSVSAVTVNLNDTATINAADVDVQAKNSAHKIRADGGFDVTSGSGGAIDIAAGSSSSVITQQTDVVLGEKVIVTVNEAASAQKRANFSATNEVVATDRAKLDSGGAITIAKVESTLKAVDSNNKKNRALVSMKSGAKIDAASDINLQANSRISLNASANARTYGLSGAGIGASEATIDVLNAIDVAGTMRTDKNIYLRAGNTADNHSSDLSAIANTDVYNKTAIPIPTDPAADARATQSNTITLQAGAVLRSVDDVNLFADKGSVLASGHGEGKDLYRELIAAVANAFGADVSLSIHSGSSVATSNEIVTVDGKVETGIHNHQKLEIAANGSVITQTEGIRGTIVPVQESLTSYYFDQITKLEKLKHQYIGIADAEIAYGMEIDRLHQEMVEKGLAIKRADGTYTALAGTVDANGVFHAGIMQGVFVLPDIVARGGNINLHGSVTGTGELNAPKDATIEISNASANYLRTGVLTIDDAGGHITLNGSNVTSTSEINAINGGKTYQGAASIGDKNAIISVKNTYIPSGAEQDVGPDLQIQGNITNWTGSIDLSNSKGSIIVQAGANGKVPNLIAKTISIASGRDFIQAYNPGFVETGGSASAIWADQVAANESAKTNAAVAQSKAGAGSIVAANNIVISARYLNINGLVQSGFGAYQVTIPDSPSLDAEIVAANRKYLRSATEANKKTLLKSVGLGDHALSDVIKSAADNIAVFWNAETKTIELESVTVQGGHVDLFGQIINTGGGQIKAMDGYGDINVNNTSRYAITLNGLSTGANVEGVIRITDTAKRANVMVGGVLKDLPVTTIYTRGVDGKVNVAYRAGTTDITQADLKTDVFNDGNGLVQSRSAAPTISSRSSTYNPELGSTYVWNTGQQFTQITEKIKSTSSALGFIPTGSDGYDSVNVISSTPGTVLDSNSQRVVVNANSMSDSYSYQFQKVETAAETKIGRSEWNYCSKHAWILGCVERTYVTKDTYVLGYNNIHKFALKADNAIGITFIGNDVGTLKVASGASINLAGVVQNQSGDVSLSTGTGSIKRMGEKSTIIGKNIILNAGKDIGSDSSAIKIEQTAGGSLTAVASGNLINLASTQGDLALSKVNAGNGLGKVTINAAGQITQAAFGNTAVISANQINLTASAVGTATQALNIQQAGNVLTAGLSITADKDISVRQANGDLRIVKIETQGDVKLEAASGSLLDNNPDEKRDKRTEAQLLSQWNSLELMVAPTRDSDVVKAYERKVEREYADYWTFDRDSNGAYSYKDTATDLRLLASNPIAYAENKLEKQKLHQQFSADAVQKDNFKYIISDAEFAKITEGAVWTESQLRNSVDKSIAGSKDATSTDLTFKDPNVKGRNVTLLASANVGQYDGSITVLSNDKKGWTPENILALTSAEKADISRNSDGDVTIKRRKALNVTTLPGGELNATANGFAYLGSKDALYIDKVTGKGISIKGKEGLYRVANSGTLNIQTTNNASVILEGGDGGIGSDAQRLMVDVGNGTVIARTAKDIVLGNPTGNLNLAELYSQNCKVDVLTSGSVLDARGTRDYAINAHDIILLAQNGSVGQLNNAMFVKLHGGTADVSGNSGVYLTEATGAGDLALSQLSSGLGNVVVKALDGDLIVRGKVNTATGASFESSGKIHFGQTAQLVNGNGVVSLNAEGIDFAAHSNLDAGDARLVLNASNGDVQIGGTLRTGNNTKDALIIKATGRMYDDAQFEPAIVANEHNAKIVLAASGDIGAAGNPLDIQVSKLDASSMTGGIWIREKDELSGGTLTAAKQVVLSAATDVILESVKADTVMVSAQNATIASLLSHGNSVIDGKDNVTLSSVTVGDISHQSDLTVSAGNGLLSIGNAAVTQDVKLNAARMQLGSIIAGRDVSLVSTQGDVIFSGVLEAGQSIQTDVHASLTGSAGSVMQAATVNAVAASMDLDAVTVSRTATLSTNHSGLLGAHNLRVGQLIVNGFEDVNLGQVQVATTTQLNAGRDLQLTTLDSVQQVDIEVGRDALFDTIIIDKAGLNAKVGRDMTVTTLLKSAETVNIDIGRDGVFKTVNVDESNPNADLNVSAGGDLTLEKDGTAARTYLKAGGGLSLSVSGVVDGDSTVLSAKRVAVNAQSIKLLGVEAQEWIKLNARAGAVTLGYITQGDKLDAAATRNGYVDIHATGDMSIGDMYSRGTTNLRSDSSVDVVKFISHKNAAIMAQDHIRLGSVIVGDVNTAANLAIAAKTGSVSIASATASQDASLSAVSMKLGEIHAGRDLAMIATKGDLDFARQLQAGRQLTMTVNGVLTGATGSLVQANSMNALANAIRLDQVDVAQHAELIARSGDILVNRMQVGSVKVDAQTGDALLHTVNSKGNAQITAGRNVVLTDIAVGDATQAADLQVSALNGKINLIDLAEVSQDAQLNATDIRFNRLKVGRNAQLMASAGIEGNSLFTGNSANLGAGDFIAIDEMTALVATDLKTLRVPAVGASGISVNKLRTNNLQASTPSALVLNDAMIGKTAVLRAAITKANLSHAGEAALDLDVTGNPGELAEKIDLQIDSVKGIDFRNLKAIIANITTNSSNNVIQKGRITGQLSFVSPQGELWMNNVNAASLPGKLLQMYVADGAFSMAQSSNYFTTDAYVTYFDPVARPTVTNYSTLRDVVSVSVAGVSAERDLNRVPLGLAKADVQIAEDRMFASTAVWSSWNASKFALLDVNKLLDQNATSAGEVNAEEERWNTLIEESLVSKKGAVCPSAGADVKQPSCTSL